MTKGIVLVTGAAGGSQGQTGRHVSELLLKKGVAVRALVRRIDARSKYLRSLGADVIVGDFLDYHSVEQAVQGVSAVYFAYPVQEGLLQATTIMADVARKAGVSRLIDLVMLVASPDAPTPRMRENYLSERIFEWAGIGAVHIRAAIFYENIRTLTANTITRDGSILLPWGSEDTIIPLVSAEDIAHVAAELLSTPSLVSGSSFQMIGDILALRDIVATFERVLDRKVQYHEVSDKVWSDTALSQGFNQHAVEHLSNLWRAIRKNVRTYDMPDTIHRYTGKNPKTFKKFLQEQKAAFEPHSVIADA